MCAQFSAVHAIALFIEKLVDASGFGLNLQYRMG
jgi:hypothetical protein